LHWFIFVPWLWALRPGDTSGNVVISYLGGVVAIHTLFFWLQESIVRFSNLPPYLAFQCVFVFAVFTGIPYALFFGLVHPLRKRLGAWWVALLPAIWVAVELVQPALFPYYQGVSQYRNTYAYQLASVTGIYGVTYLLVLTNCALGELVYRLRERRGVPWAVLLGTAVVFLGNVGFGAWRYDHVSSQLEDLPHIRTTQLQQHVTMEERMSTSARDAMLSWQELTSKHIRQSVKANEEPVDLVIWPEGSTPYDPRAYRVGRIMANTARNSRAPVLFGGGFAEPKVDPNTGRQYYEQRNSIYLMEQNGELSTRYDKMVPLPFGEYIPGAETFPILKEWIEGPGDFVAGTEPVVFTIETQEAGTVRFTTPICYEAIMSSLVRTQLSDVDLMIVVTNDGWFGDTHAPHQHAMLSAIRAMELGVPQLRIAYTGVSLNILPNGDIEYETEPFTEVVRTIEIPVGRIDTVYSHIGDLFAYLCLIVSLGGAVVARRRRPGGSDPESKPSDPSPATPEEAPVGSSDEAREQQVLDQIRRTTAPTDLVDEEHRR